MAQSSDREEWSLGFYHSLYPFHEPAVSGSVGWADLWRERKACLSVCHAENAFSKIKVSAPLSNCFCCFPWKNLFHFDKKQFLSSCQASKDSLRSAYAFLVSGCKICMTWRPSWHHFSSWQGRCLEEQQSKTHPLLRQCSRIRSVCWGI